MTKPIQQTVTFPTTARNLYRAYIDPKHHAAFTGAPVTISPKPDSKFSAFNHMIWGTTLYVVPNKLIVQRWRSTHFKKSDPDSILILGFEQIGKSARINLDHINVPPQDHKGVTEGWKRYYWQPLRKYLASRR